MAMDSSATTHDGESFTDSVFNLSRDSSKSIDSLNTLLMSLPEISIPLPVYNPLPLQCLAASALPDALRREIDNVIAEYSSEKEYDSMSHSDSCDDCDADHPSRNASVELTHLVLKRVKPQNDPWDNCEFGLKITGGLKCDRCHALHAVVTGVSLNGFSCLDIKEGMCVVEWCGTTLEGCSYEEVRRVLNGTMESGCSEVEVVVKKCSDNLIGCRKNISSNGFENIGVNLSRGENTEIPSSPPKKPKRPTSLLVPTVSKGNFHSQQSPTISPSDTTSHSSSPHAVSSFESQGKANLHITIPKSDSTAQALTVAMEARPKSPVGANDFQNIIAGLPNGMIQLSLKYTTELEDLRICINNVKGQSSKEINNSSEVFLNTYLIPDKMQQGVRSIRVKHDDQLAENSTSYMIPETELTSVALRVVLWDASRSKNVFFRGEVFLGLADQDIVNLGGEPTWYTVCPEDPNLPKLSKPVFSKQKAMEQLLNRFKHNLASLRQHTFKSSNGGPSHHLSPSISSPSLPHTVMKRNLSLPAKRLRRAKRYHSGIYSPQALIDILESEIKEVCAGDLNEENPRLAKLSSILQVLREKDCDEAADRNPSPGQDEEAVKKSRLSAILQVLQQDESQVTSLEETESCDVPDGEPAVTGMEFEVGEDEDGTYSMLDCTSRRRDPLPLTPTCSTPSETRPSSFQTIPDLRDSLGAGKRNRVTVYSFLEELENYITLHQTEDSLVVSNEAKAAALQCMQGSELASIPIDTETQVHYKLVDGCQSDDDLDSPGKHDTSVGVCTGSIMKTFDHSVYPAEISLHRINIVDVDREREEIERKRKSQTLPTAFAAPSERKAESNLTTTKEKKKPAPLVLPKWRSKSVGDIEDLETEEELILVRSPLTPHVPDLNISTDFLDAVAPVPSITTTDTDLDDDSAMSSLDFARRPQSIHLSVEDPDSTSSRHRATSLVPVKDESDSKKGSLTTLSKWRSLDTLVGGSLTKSGKGKSKKNSLRPPGDSLTKSNTSSKSIASIRLELQYNTLNPLHPVLTVKLADVMFSSSKALSSDFSLKGYLYHTSTGVCVLKNKTTVNMKKHIPSAPLGLLQFQTELTNLSLQVCLCVNGKLFSKKSIGQVNLDLNTIDLAEGPFNEWMMLTKSPNTS